MKIIDAYCSKGLTGFYFDDQRAIKAGASMDGFLYTGSPQTDKFKAVRQPGESLSIILVLEDQCIAVGDAAAVQYSGAGGRDALFLAEEGAQYFKKHLEKRLIGLDVTDFKTHAEYFDRLTIEGKPMHTAMRYGVTAALLEATAHAKRLTVPEVVRSAYNIKKDKYHPIPLFAQSGDERYNNVDKMILKEVAVMPHALINNIETKLGEKGELLVEYVQWLRNRIIEHRLRESYTPILHIDVYGTIGIIFDHDIDQVFKYLQKLSMVAEPFSLRIEGPIDMNAREATLEALRALREKVDDDPACHVEIVADEWCNTLDDVKAFTDKKAAHMVQVKTPDLGGVNNIIEALLYCRENGMGAYSGGTCNETDVSARLTTSIAIACEATQCLAKPGMGTDEGIMVVHNHMMRTLTHIERRRKL